MTQTVPAPDSPATVQAIPTLRHDGWTPARQRLFCEALADCGNVERAAGTVGMTRAGAYQLRRRAVGRAFALAWDAALLLARQRMIDEAVELAFEGSVERIYRDGKLVLEKRRRDPRALLATIERLGSRQALGATAIKAVAQDFEAFLDCMDRDDGKGSGGTARFMESRAEFAGLPERNDLLEAGGQLTKARLARHRSPEARAMVHQNGDSV